ncbi:helix-turn-helix domain-containing protein [Nocardioidaceae bacterium]|nr:helix-turn-helix domain-containing protein [Nocardioidaceae bacterium]
MRATLLCVDGMFDSGLAVTLDIFSTANALAERPLIEVVTASAGGQIRTGHGLRLATTPVEEVEAADLVLLPAIGLVDADTVIRTVSGHALLPQVRRLAAGGATVAAGCSATFFLAEAGLADGHTVTTSWWLGPDFRRRYSRVDLDDSQTLISDGRILTAGSAFAHIDLALSVVRNLSPQVADDVARRLLIGRTASQATFAVPSQLAASDPTVSAFDAWVRRHLADPKPLRDAARELGVSERTLQRATQQVLGLSPVSFMQQVRLDQAIHLLRTTERSVEQIAEAVGYRNAGSLRSLLRARRGTSVREVRDRR